MSCTRCDSNEKACHCETQDLRRSVSALCDIVHRLAAIIERTGVDRDEVEAIMAELRTVENEVS